MLNRSSTLALLVALALSASACSRQTAEEKGQALATEKIDTVKGIGSALEAKGSEAAESLTAGLGRVKQGVERGIERSGRGIELGPAVAAAKLQILRVQDLRPGAAASAPQPHGLEAYIVTQAEVRGLLRVYGLDVMGREIVRAKLSLDAKADDARYQLIAFEPSVQLGDIKTLRFDFEPAS